MSRKSIFTLPVHHENIMARIKSFYQNIQNSDIYMKDLNLEKIIRELVSKELALGTRIVLLVEKINYNIISQMAY